MTSGKTFYSSFLLTSEYDPLEVVAHRRWISGQVWSLIKHPVRISTQCSELCKPLRLVKHNTNGEVCIRNLKVIEKKFENLAKTRRLLQITNV